MAWHTPGPWRPHTLPNGSHHIIADHWGASVAVTMFPESGSEGREANARLIAAAPDLFEAVRAVLSRFHDTLDNEAALILERALTKATRGE
jgi:predicted phosphoribosyltransferase